MKFLLIFIFISGASSLTLVITPNHTDAGVSGASFRVMCMSNEPLTYCQFKWRDIYGNDGPLMDLSEGPKTPVATNYSYVGNGLDKGECGISLNRPKGVQRWVVCCRVRSRNSGWHYAHMTLFAHLKSATALTTSPSQTLVQQGGNITIRCDSLQNPLSGCMFRLPNGLYIPFNSGPLSASTSFYRYFGSGLNAGTCGISLYGVTESNSGFLWCEAWGNNHDEWRSFAIIVADLPSVPVLYIKALKYVEGDVLTATCTVKNALALANISWYIDGKIVRQDFENEASTKPWVWPFELQTIKQTYKIQLNHSDNGKILSCKIKQSELLPELQSNYTINFYRDNKVPDSIMLNVISYTLMEGNILLANCSVSGGYPSANITWFLGSKSLKPNKVIVNNDVLVETIVETVKAEDNGQKLLCVVDHPRLFQTVQKSKMIYIEHAPQVLDKADEQFKFRIGSPAIASVEFISNPKSNIFWTIDGTIIEEGVTDVTGIYEAAFQIKKNTNVWVAQLFINNVTLRDLKANFFLNVKNQYGEEYFRCLNFNTTKPADIQGFPDLNLSPSVNGYFSVGANINATCTVTRNRPSASFLWFLSNVTVTKGVSNPVLLQTTNQGNSVISQSIIMQVSENDDGSRLTCLVSKKRKTVTISVMYPPKKLTPIIQLYGFEVGKPGVLSVELSANPRPFIMWEVGGIVIREDEVTAANGYHAPQALSKAQGLWVAKLFINNVTQMDIKRDFALTARNDAGSRTYLVRLLTTQLLDEDIYNATYSKEITMPLIPVSTTQLPTIHENITKITKIVNDKTNKQYNNISENNSMTSSPPPQISKMSHGINTTYPYWSICNSIAILVLILIGSLYYIRLLHRFSRISQGIDLAPLSVDNMYYDQMNSSERQCNPTLD